VIVIDASALAELLIGGTPLASRVADRISSPSITLHAPHLVDLEVTSVLRTLEARLPQGMASTALATLALISITRYAHEPLLPRIWQLRGNVTPCDAAYIALAEALRVPLVTCDANLAAAPGNRANIELIA
jgi:predicted nucleic acid-binding protein